MSSRAPPSNGHAEPPGLGAASARDSVGELDIAPRMFGRTRVGAGWCDARARRRWRCRDSRENVTTPNPTARQRPDRTATSGLGTRHIPGAAEEFDRSGARHNVTARARGGDGCFRGRAHARGCWHRPAEGRPSPPRLRPRLRAARGRLPAGDRCPGGFHARRGPRGGRRDGGDPSGERPHGEVRVRGAVAGLAPGGPLLVRVPARGQGAARDGRDAVRRADALAGSLRAGHGRVRPGPGFARPTRERTRAPFLSPSNRTLIDRAIETARGTRRATLEGTRGYVLPGRARARVGARAISGDTPRAIWVTFFVLETRVGRTETPSSPNPSPTHVLRTHAYSDKPLFSCLVFVALPSPCRSGLRFTPICAFLRAPLCAGRGTARAWILTARFTKTTTRRGRASWSF